MKVCRLKPLLSDDECGKLAGKMLNEGQYSVLYQSDVDVICEATGITIAKFRKNIIPKSVSNSAYKALAKMANTKQDNRGIAAGWDEEKVNEVVNKEGARGFSRQEGSLRFKLVLKDGSLSKTNRAVPVKSNVIGFMDRSPRFPYCRQTAFTSSHLEKFKKAYPIIKLVDNVYRELMPVEYGLQKEQADASSQDFVIPNTSFSTVTVNKDWQTAVHKDAGDFEKGFGNLVAIRKGKYEGGYFVVPKWGCAFDLQNGDMLLVDVHQWHGNTPIKKITKNAERLSLVMYFRKNIIHCGTNEEELERVKNRKRGQKVN